MTGVCEAARGRKVARRRARSACSIGRSGQQGETIPCACFRYSGRRRAGHRSRHPTRRRPSSVPGSRAKRSAGRYRPAWAPFNTVALPSAAPSPPPPLHLCIAVGHAQTKRGAQATRRGTRAQEKQEVGLSPPECVHTVHLCYAGSRVMTRVTCFHSSPRDGKHAGEGDTGAVEHTEGTEDAGDEDLATLNVEVPADDDPNRMLPQLRRAREHARKGDPSPPTPTASAVTGAQLSPLPEADRRTRPRLGDSGAASTAGSAAKQEPGAPAPPVPPATLTAAKAETASPTAVKTESKLVFAHQGTAVAPDQGLFGRPSFGM